MNKSKIVTSIHEMIDNAEANLRSARQLLIELESHNGGNKAEPIQPSENYPVDENKDFTASEKTEAGNRIVEGRFDGQNMIGPDKKSYPVPANYASKSKLIPGDILKLTVMPDGHFFINKLDQYQEKE